MTSCTIRGYTSRAVPWRTHDATSTPGSTTISAGQFVLPFDRPEARFDADQAHSIHFELPLEIGPPQQQHSPQFAGRDTRQQLTDLGQREAKSAQCDDPVQLA